jgi:hypothetical protein
MGNRLFALIGLFMGVAGTSAAYAQVVADDAPMQIDSLAEDPNQPQANALRLEDTLRIADSLRVADSLRLAEAERLAEAARLADSLRMVRQADSLRQQRHIADVLQTAWTEWYDAQPHPDTTVVAPKTAAAKARAARVEAQLRAAAAARIDTLKAVADRQAALAPQGANIDLRMPLIISNSAPVDPLQPCDVASLQAQPRRRSEPENVAAQKFTRGNEVDKERQRTIDTYFAAHPFEVQYQRGRMLKAPEKEMMKNDNLLRGSQIDVASFDINYAPLKGSKPSADKWHYHGYSTYQMTQTAMSDNWYKGGENNMTIYSDQKLQIKRYDADKITTFESTIQLKLGFYYTKADTIHEMRVNDNQLSIDVKYGYKAWKRWYYSTSMTFKTPIFNFYPANSHTVKSAFLSPAELNVNVGMDYSYENKKKTVSYSLMLAPLSYYMKYVNNDKVSVTQYGIDANHRVLNQLGSSLTSKLTWKICNSVEWSSRLYAFTSYDSFLGEFENTFTFRVNRYLSANVMLYPRIDDGTAYDPWQMKEMLTFGFNYVWK